MIKENTVSIYIEDLGKSDARRLCVIFPKDTQKFINPNHKYNMSYDPMNKELTISPDNHGTKVHGTKEGGCQVRKYCGAIDGMRSRPDVIPVSYQKFRFLGKSIVVDLEGMKM